MALAHESDDSGSCAAPKASIAAICEWTCFGRTAVIDALKVLESAHLIVLSKEVGRSRACQIDLQEVAARCVDPSATRTTTRTRDVPVTGEPVRQADGYVGANPSASRMGAEDTRPPNVPVCQPDPSASRTGESVLTDAPGGRVDADPSASRTTPIREPDGSGPNPSASRMGQSELRAVCIPSSSTSSVNQQERTPSFCVELELTGGEGGIPEPVLFMPLVGGAHWPVTRTYFGELGAAFPGVDVKAELLRARLWCDDNPTKRKTKSGIRRFITGWMTKAQNDAGRRGGGQRIPGRTAGRHTGFDQTDYEGAPDGSIPIPP